MNKVTCIRQSVYIKALTRGRKYEILAQDKTGRNVKIKGDNGRVRWYPILCFDVSGSDVPVIQYIKITDEITYPLTSFLDVDVSLTNGENRWCLFVTPELLMRIGEQLREVKVRIQYGIPHMIIVSELNEEIIRKTLHYIDNQVELLNCTLPV